MRRQEKDKRGNFSSSYHNHRLLRQKGGQKRVIDSERDRHTFPSHHHCHWQPNEHPSGPSAAPLATSPAGQPPSSFAWTKQRYINYHSLLPLSTLLFSCSFSSSLPSPLCCRPTPHLILLSSPLHGDKEHTFMPSVFLDSTLSPISFFLCLYCCVVVLLCVSSCVLRLLRLLRPSLSPLPTFSFFLQVLSLLVYWVLNCSWLYIYIYKQMRALQVTLPLGNYKFLVNEIFSSYIEFSNEFLVVGYIDFSNGRWPVFPWQPATHPKIFWHPLGSEIDLGSASAALSGIPLNLHLQQCQAGSWLGPSIYII